MCIRQLNGDVTDAGQATSKGNGRLGHFHLVSRRSFYFPPFSMTSSLLPPVFHLLLLLPKSSWRTPTFREEPCPRHYSSSSTLSLEKKNSFSLPLRSAIERQESTGIWLNRGPDWSVLTSSWHRLRLISYLPVKHGTHTHVSVWLLTGRLWRRFLVRRLAHLNVSGQQPSQRVCHGTTRWLYSSLLHPE